MEEHPNKTWDELVEKYQNQGKTGDDLWNEIIRASTRSNAAVDREVGLFW